MNRLRTLSSLMLALALAGTVSLTGCASNQPASETDPETSMEATDKVEYGTYDTSGKATAGRAGSGGGMNYNSLHFPGLTSGPVVLEKVIPSSVNAGEPFDYMIKVYNVSSTAVTDVTVTETLAEGFEFDSASPSASKDGQKLTWNMPRIAPNSVETITVTGSATEEGTLESCATVVFVPSVCVVTTVVKPDLELTKTMPAEVLKCDPIPVTYTVTNPGSGTLKNVVVTDPLPEGLQTASGKDNIKFTIDSLAPGESRAFQAELSATETGEFTNTATATAGELEVEDSATVAVMEPVLTIDKTGPETQYIGRNVTYTITVSNTGDATAANTVVTDTIGSNVEFVSASANGVLENGIITWNLGDLAPEASKELEVTVKPTGIGTIENTAVATAVCAKDREVSSDAATKVVGIPAVLLEVVDVTDPVEVGETTTYVITVTNQGTAVDSGIEIVATLEDEMEFVSAGGATNGAIQGKTVTFDALPALAAKDQAQFTVTVRAAAAGDVRFSVKMNTDNIGREVIETEATNFYQ